MKRQLKDVQNVSLSVGTKDQPLAKSGPSITVPYLGCIVSVNNVPLTAYWVESVGAATAGLACAML